MSKILQKGDTGFGILIERDAGFISPEINNHILTENFKVKPNEPILINCVLQKWGVKNKNGRIYPKEILMRQVDAYQELVRTNSAVSEANHPDNTIISLGNISHLITKMWWGKGIDENVLYGQLKLIVTRGYINYGVASVIGDEILLYLENKIRIGISSRGVGSLKEINGENLVQDDFELVGFDLVSTPSTPGAYLFPQMDGTDTKFNENTYKSPSLNMSETKIVDTINKFLL